MPPRKLALFSQPFLPLLLRLVPRPLGPVVDEILLVDHITPSTTSSKILPKPPLDFPRPLARLEPLVDADGQALTLVENRVRLSQVVAM